MRLSKIGIYALLGALATAGCSSSSGADPGGTTPTMPPEGGNAPPGPATDHPPCVISADCPAGEHCDLSECVQDCNTKDPCTGDLTCSPRARCVPAGAPDADPTPTTQHSGDVTATPTKVTLTEQDSTFAVQLQSSSTAPVRYRIESSAPHVNIDKPTGEFTGSTTLTFKVSAANLAGRDVAGSVKVFTTLGDVVVSCPIHVGLTGSYHGALRYSSGAMTLGDAQIALDMIQTNSEIQVRVDSKRSLLFPATTAGETTGHGSYSISGGLDVTLSQAVDPSFGGDRNHFRRPLGRKVRLQLKPAADGTLTGPFTETIYGLFGEPITTGGTATLTYEPQEQDPSFTVAQDPAMPPSPSPTATLGVDAVFGWNTGDCPAVICGSDYCTPSQYPPGILSAESNYAGPLQTTIKTSQPFDALSTACAASLSAKSLADYTSPATQCGLVAPLACAIQVAATRVTTSDITTGKAAGRLVNETLAPAALVAKNEIVNALAYSFAVGPSVEKQHYDTAMTTLGPVATWLEQPAILEYLRSLPPEAAKGDDPGGNPATFVDTYPAARALADLFHTESVIDGERARIAGASTTADPASSLLDAQQRAVLTFLEAATLGEILREWGTTPDSVAATFIGALNPLNHGFGALLNGANAFGVPSYYVPFVYRPEDVGKGASNFEQMLNLAGADVAAEASSENTFTTDYKTVQANNAAVQSQLATVRLQYDQRLHDICGAGFDPDQITTEADWQKCGAGKTGQIGSLLTEMDLAQARVDASLARMKAARAKIQIDADTLDATQKIRSDDIQYQSDTGEQLSAFIMADGALSAAEGAIQVAAQASIMNLGAPLAEAGPMAVIGMVKAGIEGQEQELRNAQQMHAEASQQQIDLLNGEAAIQKETIDLIQMGVDLHQDVLGVLQAQIAVQNAIGQAREIFTERAQALALINKDPTNDPSYRLLRDAAALNVIQARAAAQAKLYLAASALEYELDMSVPSIDGAVLRAYNASSITGLQTCLLSIYNDARVAYGTPQDYVTTVSVRQMLGIKGPRTDAVTGQTLSEGDQFRQLLLRNENLDGKGGVGITFATDLQAGNGLWSTDVCEDRLSAVQAQLVGDFLGDNQAQVNLLLSGTGTMRSCDGTGAVASWALDGGNASSSTAFAVIQAGVNTYGDAPPNSSLFGQPVARATWQLVVPGGQAAPSNADVDLTHVDDIVLKFSHKALPSRSSPLAPDLSCLDNVGGK